MCAREIEDPISIISYYALIQCITSLLIPFPAQWDGFPWINQEIRRLIRKRDKLYKRWSRSGRPYDHNKFLEQKHLVRRVSERA